MKRYIFGLLFTSLLSNALGQDASHALPELTYHDQQMLQYLYNLDGKSTAVEKTENLNLDYFICTLYDHIQILKHKIKTKKSGWTSQSFGNGLVFLSFTGLFGTLPFLQSSNDPSNVLAIFAVPFFLLASHCFYKAAHYQQRLQQRLERDKRIFRKLQAEYRLQNSVLSL
jgi:hypothetical protein